MRKLLLIMILASVLSFSFAQAYTLDASLSDSTQGNIEITNCKSPSGGSTMQKISISITSAMPVQMKVSYKYLDLPSNTYKDGLDTVKCVVPPSFSKSCDFTVPIILGGTGNGTGKNSLNNVELIRLTGEDFDGKRKEVYSRSLFFSISHEESLQETNVYNKIKEARAFLSQLTAQMPCVGSVCCGMGGAFAKSEQAKLDIQNAEEQVKLCGITSAYAFASSAFANAKGALTSSTTNTGSCQEAIQSYKDAQKAVDEAESKLLGLQCMPDSSSSQAVDKAKGKLANAGKLIGVDDYEAAALELESAKKASIDAKSLVKCASGSETDGSSTGTGESGSGTESSGQQQSGNQSGSSGTGKAPPLCPLGMAIVALVGFGTYARSKR